MGQVSAEKIVPGYALPKERLQRSGLGTVDTATRDTNPTKNGGVRTRTPPGI
jgi:hypothetical protein